MPTRSATPIYLAALAVLAVTAACADPFIESTTSLGDTRDPVGPYLVYAAVVGAAETDRVELRHSRPQGDERVLVMSNLGDDGDGPGDLYRAEIGGQPVGSVIAYYVLVFSGDSLVDRDPPGDGASFVFSVTP